MISQKKKKKKYLQFSACQKNGALDKISLFDYKIDEKLDLESLRHYQ